MAMGQEDILKMQQKILAAHEATSKQMEQSLRAQERLSKSYVESEKHMGRVADLLEKSATVAGKGKHEKSLKKRSDGMKDLLKSEVDYQKALLRTRAISKEEYKQNLKALKETIKYRKEAQKAGLSSSVGGKYSEIMRGKARGGVGGSLKTVFGKSGFKSTVDAANNLKSYGKAAAFAAKQTGSARGAVGLFAKNLLDIKKANAFGLIVAGLKAFISTSIKLNKFLTGVNKQFLEVAGPAGSLGDVSGSMKTFGDTVYDLGRNMKMGLKADDIQGLFKSVSGAGLSIQGLMQRVGDYGKVIDGARRMSLQFGVSFQEMGTMMTGQMMNLRSSLEDVRSTFNSLSYDAARAGIQSQKFYQTIESASMSLSFYGNFLKSTSARLRDILDVGNMGFKDASEHATNMMNIFKNMGLDQRRAFVTVAGPEKIRGMFADQTKAIETQMGEQDATIANLTAQREQMKNSEDRARIDEEIKAAKNRQRSLRQELARAAQLAEKGNITELAAYLPGLSKDMNKLITEQLGDLNIDIFEREADAFQYITSQMGLSLEDATKYMEKAKNSAFMLTQFVGEMGKDFDTARKDSKGAFIHITEVINQFKQGKGALKTMEDAQTEVQAYLEASGVTGKAVQGFLELMRTNIEGAEELAKSGSKAVGRQVKSITLREMKRRPTEDRGSALEQDQMDELVNQSTALADYLDIGKENLRYALAQTRGFKDTGMAINATARRVGGILGILTKWWRGTALGGSEKGKEESFDKKYKDRMKRLYSNQYVLTKKMHEAEAKEDFVAAEEHRKELKLTKEQIAGVERDFSHLLPHLKNIREEASAETMERQKRVGELEKLSKIEGSRVEAYRKRLSLLRKAQEEGRGGDLSEKITEVVSGLNKASEAHGKYATELSQLTKETDNQIAATNKEITQKRTLSDIAFDEALGKVKPKEAKKILGMLTGDDQSQVEKGMKQFFKGTLMNARGAVSGTLMSPADIKTLASSPEWKEKMTKALDEKVRVMQQGGIVNTPTLAKLGENGPEMVTPLTGGRGTGAGGVSVSVTISGNVYGEIDLERMVESGVTQGLNKAAYQGQTRVAA